MKTAFDGGSNPPGATNFWSLVLAAALKIIKIKREVSDMERLNYDDSG